MKLETVAETDYPPGNIAISPEGRIFFTLHPEAGPPVNVVEWVNGTKDWYLNGKLLTEQEFNDEMNNRNNSCEGKVVEIDGKKYKLKEV